MIDFGVAKAVAEKTNAMALTHGGFVGHAGICESGTIYQCACRCALGHLLVRRDALVFADRTNALQRPDD